MKKIIAAMNMTVDGFCDHTATVADEELHEHYNDMLRNTGILVYGRITYQMMESYWPTIVKEPTGEQSTDDFAVLMDNIPKIVYSRTLPGVDWKTSDLKREINKDEITRLKQEATKDIFVGSPSMIVAFTQLDLIDEYQLVIQPIILGNGLQLFKNISDRINLKLVNTKTFGSGAVMLSYEKVQTK